MKSYEFKPVMVEIFGTQVYCVNDDVALKFLIDLEESMTVSEIPMDEEYMEEVFICLSPEEAMKDFLSQTRNDNVST